MVAMDVELLLHHGIRLLMREEGMSADEAFDTAVTLLVVLRAEETKDAAEALALVMEGMLLPELRERILPAYRKPNPDLSDLEPVIQAEMEAARAQQRQRRRRRQLGGRP